MKSPHSKTKPIQPHIERVYGKTSIDTAERLASAYFSAADTVYLVNAEIYSDALSALNRTDGCAPILWVQGVTPEDHTLRTLRQIAPKRVVLMGDERRISQEIENHLNNFFDVRRIGGKTVYETNALSLKDSEKKNIIVTCADDYSGSLLAPALAMMTGAMIALTYGKRLAPEHWRFSLLKNGPIVLSRPVFW